ncbi:MAG: PD40 domain-containing protein [Chitinophagaceae bacterium]|nr:PD40 domain-containing protein [Chitinophagaceae bacterium]
MPVIRTIKILLCLCVITAVSCKKSTDDNTVREGAVKNLPGTIYWYFAGSAGYYEFNSGKFVEEMMKMGVGSSRFDAFDISWDNKKLLLTMDVEGTFNFDERRLVLRDKSDHLTYQNIQDGNNIKDFTFEWGEIATTYAHLSPNEKYVAVDAQFFSDLPVSILGTDGTLISSWVVNGVSFLNYGIPVWTADNTLYFRIGNNLYKSGAADGFSTAPKVLALDQGSSFVTVNPQGTKIAFRRNKHLWMCNIDGSQLQQITTSQTFDAIDYDGENRPVFSPDGKYIAFTGATRSGTPWSEEFPDGSWVVTTGGKFGYIIVIPADGKLYDLDDKHGGAIWLTHPGSGSRAVACSEMLIWR